MKKFPFTNLIPKASKTEGEFSVINELNAEIKSKTVLYYPSSGIDINDLFYVHSKKIEELNKYSPDIFIHSDYMHKWDYGFPTFDQIIGYPNFHIISKLKFYNANKSISLYKLELPNSNEIKWLVFFRGYYNEEVLKELVINEIKTPVIYAICDGITHGMGNCYEKSVPTILYPLLSSYLDINFLITEQGIDSICERLKDLRYNRDVDEFRSWIINISYIINNHAIKSLLDLSDEDLRKRLRTMLSTIYEEELNKEGRLRCYTNQLFFKNTYLKTIKNKFIFT